MASGWTGGQFSILRVLAGLACVACMNDAGWFSVPDGWAVESLAARSMGWVPWVTGLIAVVALPAFVLGYRSRPAALLMALVVTCRTALPPHQTPTAFLLVVVLVVMALHPPAPFLSWAARGRVDPSGGWERPDWLQHFARFLVAFLLPVTALLRLTPIGGLAGLAPEADDIILARQWVAAVAFVAPGMMFLRTRRVAWCVLVLGWLALALLGADGPTLVPIALLLLLAAEPQWLPRAPTPAPAQLLYDGSCGLCHRTVRFLLAEAPGDESLTFAPLEGETARRALEAHEGTAWPDSVLLVDASGVRTQSDAVIALLRRLPGIWPLLGSILSLIPRFLRDGAYAGIARARRRLFPAPDAACPILPPHLRERFRA